MKITTIILDWAGTAVDFGSFAPVDAFMNAFAAFGIQPTLAETRAPMGLPKRAHIATMLSGERLAAQWAEKHGKAHDEADIDAVYEKFEPALFKVLKNYAAPLPGVIEAVTRIRDKGIKIGSTTGYTRAMMEVVAPIANERGYAPDCLACPEDVGGRGRPYPYMLWRNLEKLKVAHVGGVLKVGDTDADIQEGKAAGCLSVGVIAGSNVLGLTENEFEALDPRRKEELYAETRQKYFDYGADFVIDRIKDLPKLITMIGG
ncbi:MAG: phosphonoacetaldehyde hydrolase [Treponema sp.]|nr:phosphonoacetaldehyde hydrolase [Treponema sp.]